MSSARRTMLSSVQRVREGVDPHRHLPFGRHMLRIPEADFYALCKLYPALNSRDPVEKSAALEAFERHSPFAEKYRVGRIVRGIIKDGVIQK